MTQSCWNFGFHLGSGRCLHIFQQVETTVPTLALFSWFLSYLFFNSSIETWQYFQGWLPLTGHDTIALNIMIFSLSSVLFPNRTMLYRKCIIYMLEWLVLVIPLKALIGSYKVFSPSIYYPSTVIAVLLSSNVLNCVFCIWLLEWLPTHDILAIYWFKNCWIHAGCWFSDPLPVHFLCSHEKGCIISLFLVWNVPAYIELLEWFKAHGDLATDKLRVVLL